MRVPRRRVRRKIFDRRFVDFESRRSYRMAFLLFWSILLSLVCQRYVVSLGIVTDRSMNPTLTAGDHYLVNRYIYRLTRPQRGHVVVLRRNQYDTDEYVKRIIAAGGDSLFIRSGTVYVNGRPLKEPYTIGGTYPNVGPVHLQKDAYFVMGDNRLRSEDSRHFGPVMRSEIDGKIHPNRVFSFL